MEDQPTRPSPHRFAAGHCQIAETLCGEITVRRLFRDYQQIGYYPFFLESSGTYIFRLREVINHILEVDLPLVNRIEVQQLSKLKKLLYLLATSVPFSPNISKLAEATDISRPRLYEYLENLQDARLLNLVRKKSFVVADDIETGFQNKIPLWLFGFLY